VAAKAGEVALQVLAVLGVFGFRTAFSLTKAPDWASGLARWRGQGLGVA
jgi:chemotaxis signal transduction protein